MRLSDRAQLTLMLAPFLVGISLWTLGPALAGFSLAFTDYNPLKPIRFAGLANFRELATDHVFWLSVRNSLFYIALAVPLRLLGALLMALLLLKPGRTSTLFRGIVYLPTVIPDMAWALIWLWILNPLYGPLNHALEFAGLHQPQWLTDPTATRFAIVLMMVWQIGEGFVVALASLQNVERDLLDQAAVDGSSRLRTFTAVTLPAISLAMMLLMFRDTVFSFQANFVPAMIVGKGGGPDYATMFMPMYIYREAFSYLRMGYAAAMTTVMFAITGLVILMQFGVSRRMGVRFNDGE